MKNMKSLLRLIGALALTTGATASVVACPPANVTPDKIEDKYAKLLNLNQIVETFSDDYKLVKNNADEIKSDFASLLNNDNIGKDDDAIAFLQELGFKVGSDNKYSAEDAKAIKKLTLNINKDENKISLVLNNSKDDFLAKSSVTFEIKKDNKVLKAYTLETNGSNLEVKTKITALIRNKDDLKLDKDTNFVKSGSINDFKLVLNDSTKNTMFKNLIETLGRFNINEKLIWSSDAAGTTKINNFSNTTNNFLTIKVGEVTVISNIDCGSAVLDA